MPRPLARLPAILFVLSCVSPATAAVFCVDTATEIQNALSTAASNGENDQVQIVQGTYVGNFVYATATEEHDLAIQGGWTAGCVSREIDPANTVLDGNQTGTVLVLSADGRTVRFLVKGLTFENGMGRSGGGLFWKSGPNNSIELTASVFANNTASNGGGGAYFEVSNGAVTVDHCSIYGNSARNLHGGGIDIKGVHGGEFIVTDSVIEKNEYFGYGGGVNLSVYGNNGRVNIVIANNVIEGNRNLALGGSRGGGVHVYASSAGTFRLVNNSIRSNAASGGFGGGLFIRFGVENDSFLTFLNNVLWQNTSDSGADLWIDNDADDDFLPTPVALLNNNFDQTPGSGFYSTLPISIDPSNFNAVDPMFADPDYGDLRLKPGSPMIDAGNPDTPNLPATDLYGNPRVIGGIVDIGAYESFASPNRVLTVLFEGAGSGRVASTPTGIDCDQDCSAIFPRGTPVTLTSVSAAFTGWSGACSGVDACEVTLDQARTVTATFDLCTTCLPSRGGWRATLKP